jgi:hypothetical protein
VASASPTLALLAGSLAVLAAGVSGCATTQDANRRAAVQADRTIASRERLAFRSIDPNVRVVSTSVVNGKACSAIVAVLRNHGDAPVNDLPIEVGPAGGQPVNAGPNVAYFQSHAPAIAPGAEATWVYVSRRPLGSSRAFVRVGAPVKPPTSAGHVSELNISDPSVAGSNARAEITNGTGIPQYDLDVYAVAVRAGHYVAAGRISLTHLGVDQSSNPTVPLIGDAEGARVRIFAPQTLFQ